MMITLRPPSPLTRIGFLCWTNIPGVHGQDGQLYRCFDSSWSGSSGLATSQARGGVQTPIARTLEQPIVAAIPEILLAMSVDKQKRLKRF